MILMELLMNFQIHRPDHKHIAFTKDTNLIRLFAQLKKIFFRNNSDGTITVDGEISAKFFIKATGQLTDSDREDLRYLGTLLR